MSNEFVEWLKKFCKNKNPILNVSEKYLFQRLIEDLERNNFRGAKTRLESAIEAEKIGEVLSLDILQKLFATVEKLERQRATTQQTDEGMISHLEQAAFTILKDLQSNPNSLLKKFTLLKQWLNKHYLDAVLLREEFITADDVWLAVIITADRRKGIVVPTLHTPIGTKPGIFVISGGSGFFEAINYHGEELRLEDIKKFAIAGFNEVTRNWVRIEKGIIDKESIGQGHQIQKINL